MPFVCFLKNALAGAEAEDVVTGWQRVETGSPCLEFSVVVARGLAEPIEARIAR